MTWTPYLTCPVTGWSVDSLLERWAPDADARPASGPTIRLDLVSEATPGAAWRHTHRLVAPALHRWYAGDGLHRRPSLATGRAALADAMPELVPVWERLVDLADGDELSARLLTMWDVPSFIAGCTQGVTAGPRPVLVRNYDYDARLLEGVVSSTAWSGRRIIGTSDLLWGLLDGMNDDGLAVSLTWGGRPGSAPGFAIPLVVRYLLETCEDVPHAVERLRRLPVAQAYNLTLLDRAGRHRSVFVAPGCAPEESDLVAVANHALDRVEHPAAAEATASPLRQKRVTAAIAGGADDERLVETFLRAPVHSRAHGRGFGTLYTAAYDPQAGTLTYHWPGERPWRLGFEDRDGGRRVALPA